MTATEHELYQSCRVLFGLDSISRDFLEHVQISGLKSAYRKKARETHPDMKENADERAQKKSADQFCLVRQSYEQMTGYLSAKEKGFRFPPKTRPIPKRYPAQSQPEQHHNQQTWTTVQQQDNAQTRQTNASTQVNNKKNSKIFQAWQYNTLYRGAIPDGKLLLGHFLYYSGAITWRDLAKALVWQRNSRPRIGDIAIRLGWMTKNHVLTAMNRRKPFEKIGESARRLGLITKSQFNTLIFLQKRVQNKLGIFFIKQNILSLKALNYHLASHHRHNCGIRRQSAGL